MNTYLTYWRAKKAANGSEILRITSDGETLYVTGVKFPDPSAQIIRYDDSGNEIGRIAASRLHSNLNMLVPASAGGLHQS